MKIVLWCIATVLLLHLFVMPMLGVGLVTASGLSAAASVFYASTPQFLIIAGIGFFAVIWHKLI